MKEEAIDTVSLLRQVPLFRDLSDEELGGLSTIMIQRSYRKKTVVFSEGGDKEAVYFIQQGLVKTYKTDENGHQQIVSFLKKGDMFPHTGLFHANCYPATAETIVPTTLLAMPIKPFEFLLSSTPGVAVKILRVMSQKILELQEKIQELTGQDVQNRGQLFLLKLAENNGKVKNGKYIIEMPMTHQDIANAIGTTRETVNRMLNQLRKEGIVETDRLGFVIHDMEALRHWREN
ncbi:Crp/Fnr family transcriptional regulator [Paenibacillus rigui]|uniref:Crp/Fnr family transcriptional regulator n=1 Tax=Paenibacillus rigui TaxID=554312 RepID=A0A229UW64_9BACL|nr:Crp/Fnr family transcriptional regulator [Paenibacillus rigui]OXM87553.1 Crp/Fnr family transcriptional regulator [Paenibacillus rigui]